MLFVAYKPIYDDDNKTVINVFAKVFTTFFGIHKPPSPEFRKFLRTDVISQMNALQNADPLLSIGTIPNGALKEPFFSSWSIDSHDAKFMERWDRINNEDKNWKEEINNDYAKSFYMFAAQHRKAVNDALIEKQKEEKMKQQEEIAKDAERSASFEDILEGGAKLKKTDICIHIQGRKRIIYTGRHNKRFVKVLGKFVALSLLK